MHPVKASKHAKKWDFYLLKCNTLHFRLNRIENSNNTEYVETYLLQNMLLMNDKLVLIFIQTVLKMLKI